MGFGCTDNSENLSILVASGPQFQAGGRSFSTQMKHLEIALVASLER